MKCPYCKDGFGYLEEWPRKDKEATSVRQCVCRDCGRTWVYSYPSKGK